MYSILIIDDEPIVKIALRSILPWEEHGFSFVEQHQMVLRLFH